MKGYRRRSDDEFEEPKVVYRKDGTEYLLEHLTDDELISGFFFMDFEDDPKEQWRVEN